MKALVVLSGGLDSGVALAEAIEQHGASEVQAVSFEYGQKHTQELFSAKDLTTYYSIDWEMIQLPKIFDGSGSVLIMENNLDMPESSYEEIAESDGISPTYVPFRNANFLSMATAYGMTVTDEEFEVWAGMHSEDAHNWAYPDCTPEFLGAMSNAMFIGSYMKVRLVTPHQWRTKAEIVRRGMELGAPMYLTYSCYNGEPLSCGTCPTCIGRIQAFARNGITDSAPYMIDIDWEKVDLG